jgi:hypothetical protein
VEPGRAQTRAALPLRVTQRIPVRGSRRQPSEMTAAALASRHAYGLRDCGRGSKRGRSACRDGREEDHGGGGLGTGVQATSPSSCAHKAKQLHTGVSAACSVRICIQL